MAFLTVGVQVRSRVGAGTTARLAVVNDQLHGAGVAQVDAALPDGRLFSSAEEIAASTFRHSKTNSVALPHSAWLGLAGWSLVGGLVVGWW